MESIGCYKMTKQGNNDQNTTSPTRLDQRKCKRFVSGFAWQAALNICFVFLIGWTAFKYWGENYLHSFEQRITSKLTNKTSESFENHLNYQKELQENIQTNTQKVLELEKQVEALQIQATRMQNFDEKQLQQLKKDLLDSSAKLDAAAKWKFYLVHWVYAGGKPNHSYFASAPKEVMDIIKNIDKIALPQDLLNKWTSIRKAISFSIASPSLSANIGWLESFKTSFQNLLHIQKLDKNLYTQEEAFIREVEAYIITSRWDKLERLVSLNIDKANLETQSTLREFLSLIKTRALGKQLLDMVHQYND